MDVQLFRKKKLTEREFQKELDRLRRLIREDVSAFKDDTLEKKKDRKARAEKDVLYFMETYLPHYCNEPFAEFHEALIEMADAATVTEPMAGDAPRGFAKSTIISFGYTLHKIVFKKKWFILPCSETEDQAAGITTALMLELEENPRIKADFGKLKGPSWSYNDFTTSTGIKVLARGIGQAIRGLKNGPHRPDLAIVDDGESDESAENPKRVKKFVSWVLKTVLPGLEPSLGALFIVGTLLTTKSGLAVLKANPGFKTFHFAAIQDDGTSLWPERFTVEHLLKLKELVGRKVFNSEYQGNPEDDEALFKSEWLENFYDEKDLEGREDLITVTYGDPSSESGRSNDFKATVTISVAPEAVYIRHAWIRKATPLPFVHSLYDQKEMYKPDAVGAETNAIGEFLKTALELAALDRGYPLAITAIKHSTNKTARVGRMSPLAESRRFRFIKDHSDQNLLRDQLGSFPSSTVNDDGPDALEGALDMAEGKARKAACGGKDPANKRDDSLRTRFGLGRFGGFGRRHNAA